MATIIVACDENNLIGDGETLPWSYPEDLKFFKETTTGHIIIMGKNTWNSLPRRPLPNRVNCIISRQQSHDISSLNNMDVEWYPSIAAAMRDTRMFFKGRKHFIIGGEQIYKLSLKENLVNEILMTRIKKSFKGDKFFPKLDPDVWKEVETIKENDDFKVIKFKKEKNDNSRTE